MPDSDKAPVIIVKKKKRGHGGHHGGAWKVAYADFVTAMMALFIVLWLMNSNAEIQEAVGGYFRDPAGFGESLGSGSGGSGQGITVSKTDMGSLKNKLEGALQQLPQFEQLKENVAMTVTGDGLRVELLENEIGMFFESGRSVPSASGEELLLMLATELSELPNTLLIEGHTDARPFTSRGDYSNWELSVDRANAARKLMEHNGLREGQVVQVRGFADRNLRYAEDPTHASNRRVSVIVQYAN
ncbi:MAG: OmpA family protein, partial [bacterium]|nr:OmpA family protein [bacterium]